MTDTDSTYGIQQVDGNIRLTLKTGNSEFWIDMEPEMAFVIARQLREHGALQLRGRGIDPETVPAFIGTRLD